MKKLHKLTALLLALGLAAGLAGTAFAADAPGTPTCPAGPGSTWTG